MKRWEEQRRLKPRHRNNLHSRASDKGDARAQSKALQINRLH